MASQSTKMDVPESQSVWTGRVSAKVAGGAERSLNVVFDGSFGFTVYLGDADEYTVVGDQRVPNNSVVGRIGGGFTTEISALDHKISGRGTVAYFLGGRYDPASESILIRLRPSGIEAAGKRTTVGDPSRGIQPAVAPLSLNWNTGRRSAMDDAYEDLPKQSLLLEPPKPPALHPERVADSQLLWSLPQTSEAGDQPLLLDLKDPDPQTVIQTSENGSPPGARVTTWTFTLVPLFSIEREDRTTEGVHSFLSSDSISLRVSIPGVTVPKSRWEPLVSWRATCQGPHPSEGVPSGASESAALTFRLKVTGRPTGGSLTRNRPISYDIAATIEGTTQHYFLIQDELDILRQEYVDQGLRVPGRSEFVAWPIDGALNSGSYNFILDGGILGALNAIASELKRAAGVSVKVTRGYVSPQRAKATGRSSKETTLGGSLDLVPDPPSRSAWLALQGVCVNSGYSCEFEGESGKVPIDSPDLRHVHVVLEPKERVER